MPASDFKSFLESEGYDLSLTPDRAKEKMAHSFSSTSWQRFEELMLIKEERPYTNKELYNVPSTLQEAALLLSPQGMLYNIAAQELEKRASTHLKEGARVADIGCGTGTFTRWMAKRYPGVQIVGIERHPTLLSIAKAQAAPCRYLLGDVACLPDNAEACDLLLSHFGIEIDLLDIPINRNLLSAEDPSLSALTAHTKEQMTEAFSGCKRVLKPQGCGFAVLRLAPFEVFLGAALASYEAAVPLDLKRSCLLRDGENIAALIAFSQAPQEDPDIDSLLAWWCKEACLPAHGTSFYDTNALRYYRTLQDRQLLGQEEVQYQDGHFLIKELGCVDNWGYIYEYATTHYRRLELIPKEQLMRQDRSLYTYQS